MEDLKRYLDSLKQEYKKYAYDFLANCSREEELLSLFAYYHYYGADSSKIDEIINGDVYKRDVSDSISGIYVDHDSDNNDIDIIIVLPDSNGDFEISPGLKKLKDAESLILSYKNSKNAVRKGIRDILSDDEYEIINTRGIKIILLTDYSPKSASKKKSILNALNALKPSSDNIAYEIVFGYDIEHEVLEIENPREYVEEAEILVDAGNNYLAYGDEQSLIVNVSAGSLKKLYEDYSYRGLFAQNLRYYVKNAKVDDNIVFSIQEKPENFWYYNNGIIIVCDTYTIRGNVISLKHFSIINGGQTTKLIGETDFSRDFYVQCKIVKNKYEELEKRLDFIADVAEASNTQKPIKEKDLIANRTEQRLLKKQLAESGIYCQIKRGEKVNKKLYPNAWQNTTNEELGQFLLSFTYQKPGTARNNKSSICGNKERYNLIYGKQYNSEFLADLLKIKAFYKQWMNYLKKTDDGDDSYRLGLVNNGMLFMTSIIGALCKIYYHRDYIQRINDCVMSEQRMEIISQHDVDHRIFKWDSDEKERFYELFEYCYRKYYRTGYEFLKTFKEKYNNYSNFTKVNTNYSTYVFKQISYEVKNGIPEEDLEYLRGVFYDASEEELKRDNELLEKYVNVVYVDVNGESSVPDEKVSTIKEALIAYRTKTYKLNRIKAYEVFKNVAADRIAKFAPESLEELAQLRAIDAVQLELYGEDIIRIVKEIMQE